MVAECLPQNKVEFVRQIKAKGYRVAVVGDGVNDAPALAAGDLGIAMGAAGSEVAIHSATIALMNNDLRRLPFLVKLSRQTRAVINQNFMIGVLFVIGGLVLAAMSYIDPIVAAFMHVGGSLLVVFNSARLVREGEELEPHLAPLLNHRPSRLPPPGRDCPPPPHRPHARHRGKSAIRNPPSRRPGLRSAGNPQSGDAVVSVRGLTKVFKDFWGRPKARAVDNVDFEVRRGEVFGLLGPNGSGKSTTVKMLLGLLHPTRGHIEVFGHSPRHVATKSLIGYLPEESYLYRFLDSRETLDFFGNLFDLPPAQRRRRTEELLEMVGLSAVRTRVVGEFSKGMQRRIGLAQALINDPELIILDEPTAGLDPIGCREVKDLILTLARPGQDRYFEQPFAFRRGRRVRPGGHLLRRQNPGHGRAQGIARQTRRGLHHHAAGFARNDATGAGAHRARRRRGQGGGGNPDPEPGKLLPGSRAQSQGKHAPKLPARLPAAIVAAYLRGDAEAPPAADRILQRLTAPTPPKTAAPAAPAAPSAAH